MKWHLKALIGVLNVKCNKTWRFTFGKMEVPNEQQYIKFRKFEQKNLITVNKERYIILNQKSLE